MALFICSCLVFLTKSVLLLFRFIALLVLRTSPLTEDLESTESNVMKAEEKDRMEESLESRISSFSFRFEDNNFDGDKDTGFLCAEDFLSAWNKAEIPKDMLQIKKQIFEEERFISACSETSSVAESEEGLILEEFSGFDSDTESSSDGYSVRELIVDTDCCSSFSDGYFGDCEHDSEIRQTSWDNVNEIAEGQQDLFFLERNGGGGEDSEPKPESLNIDEVGKSTEYGSDNALNNSAYVSDNAGREKAELEKEKSKETSALHLCEDEFDEIWEHQDLIEQLKMELRKVRAIGLPTILEESESPRAVEEPKPFKIHEKLWHDDPMDELHKLYKCYKERMRKFDILNYQKMYATGFLQLKDPLELKKTKRRMFSKIMSHLSQSFFPFGNKKSNCDPSEKYIKELRCDLETVYVGQTCLSWELLRWQYEKLHELSDSDSFISHQYNNVSAEFQQFKVTLQRFLENETFQGTRVANYVKQRCILRNLLQLPVVKEDCLKDKIEKSKEEDAITRERLEDIMEEAIRTFWEFVKAEKCEAPRFFKGLVESHVELQVPSDYEFMIDIQTSLQENQKKLKDILKAGNCIVKKLKRRQEDRSSQDLFFSQVDLKLVSRVLRMSRITSDQLIWCQKKMSKITFSGRKVHREPSFLLFPC